MEQQSTKTRFEDSILVVNLAGCELLMSSIAPNKGMTRQASLMAAEYLAKKYLDQHRLWHRENDKIYYDQHGRLAKCEPLVSITSL